MTEAELMAWIREKGEEAARRGAPRSSNIYVGRYRAWWFKGYDAQKLVESIPEPTEQ